MNRNGFSLRYLWNCWVEQLELRQHQKIVNLVFAGFFSRKTSKNQLKPVKPVKNWKHGNVSSFPRKPFQNRSVKTGQTVKTGRKPGNLILLVFTTNQFVTDSGPKLLVIASKFSFNSVVLGFRSFMVSKTGKPEKPEKNSKQIWQSPDVGRIFSNFQSRDQITTRR